MGICVGGNATCLADGSAFGVCLGETTPRVENCFTTALEDCSAAPDCGATLSQAVYGDAGGQTTLVVASDGAGGVVLGGSAVGAVDFGGGPLSPSGSDDVVVARLDASGAHVWSRRAGDAAAQVVSAVTVHSTSGVLLAGTMRGVLDLGTGPLTSAGGADAFVARLDATTGAVVWVRRFGDAADQAAVAVVVDTFGNVVLGGTFSGTINLGGANLTSNGGTDVFVTCMSSTGNHIWSKNLGGAGNDSLGAMTVDGSSNLFLTGAFTGSVDFGGGLLTAAGAQDAFLLKLSGPGGHLWSKTLGDTGTQAGKALAVDAAGNITAAVVFAGSINPGSGAIPSTGTQDVLVASFQPTGSLRWSRTFGVAGGVTSITATAPLTLGAAAWSLQFNAALDLGDGAQGPIGTTDAALVLLDNQDGHAVWVRRALATQHATGSGVAVDLDGRLVWTGQFGGALGLAGTPVDSAGGSDFFVARLAQ